MVTRAQALAVALDLVVMASMAVVAAADGTQQAEQAARELPRPYSEVLLTPTVVAVAAVLVTALPLESAQQAVVWQVLVLALVRPLEQISA